MWGFATIYLSHRWHWWLDVFPLSKDYDCHIFRTECCLFWVYVEHAPQDDRMFLVLVHPHVALVVIVALEARLNTCGNNPSSAIKESTVWIKNSFTVQYRVDIHSISAVVRSQSTQNIATLPRFILPSVRQSYIGRKKVFLIKFGCALALCCLLLSDSFVRLHYRQLNNKNNDFD